MRTTSVAIALALLGSGCKTEAPWSIAAPDPATRRTLVQGEVVGGLGRYGSHAWLGIPLAAPPVGEGRFRAPRPPAPWTGVRPALAFAPACVQPASPLGGGGRAGEPSGDEDCLYLNVYAPRFEPGQVPRGATRLPVLFWIHGGGNSIGRASFFDGGHLATAVPAIVVTTQYRLGPFGWLRHRALRSGAADDAERSGNFGTLDLIRGLAWARENAEAFGGDPGNVTIFGESAGGLDVYSLLVAPQARGLFQRAIVESGGLSRTTNEEAEDFVDDPAPGHRNSSNEVLLRLLERQGAAPGRRTARERLASMADAEIAALLRSRPASELLRAYDTNPAVWMLDMPLVFQDGALLPKGDWKERLAQAGSWNEVPTIVGTNRDEAKLFLFLDPRQIKRVVGLFPRFRDEARYEVLAEYQSRVWRAAGADLPAAAMHRSGEAEIYAYRFDWDEEPSVAGADLSRMLGAAHGLEVPFVFGHFELGRLGKYVFDPAAKEGRDQLSAAMMSYWGAFARSGSPGRGLGGDLPEWSAYGVPGQSLVLATPRGGGVRMSQAVESIEKIAADLDADPRLPRAVDKCRLLHDLGGIVRRLTREEYERVGRGRCGAFPFEAYPWNEQGP